MPQYDRVLSDLRDVLERADVLASWDIGHSYSIGVNLTRVEFGARLKMRTDAHVRPANISFDEASISCQLDYSGDGDFDDIANCSAEILIEGLDQESNIRTFALHFDCHDPGQNSTELHARYHWQLGGSRLDGVPIGGVVFFEGPRFPSHPLDPILLVDFTLGHFNGVARTALLGALPAYAPYRRVLHDAQSRLVAPFFSALAQALQDQPFVETVYWPALCAPSP